MATLEDIRALGYTADVAFRSEDVTVYRVEGPGLTCMVKSDDLDAIGSYARHAALTALEVKGYAWQHDPESNVCDVLEGGAIDENGDCVGGSVVAAALDVDGLVAAACELGPAEKPVARPEAV